MPQIKLFRFFPRKVARVVYRLPFSRVAANRYAQESPQASGLVDRRIPATPVLSTSDLPSPKSTARERPQFPPKAAHPPSRDLETRRRASECTLRRDTEPSNPHGPNAHRCFTTPLPPSGSTTTPPSSYTLLARIQPTKRAHSQQPPGLTHICQAGLPRGASTMRPALSHACSEATGV